MKKKVMEIVRKICDTKSKDCRGLSKSDLARELMNVVNIPQNAKIKEIPIDWGDMVNILFLLPDDKNYYSLFAGIGVDGVFTFELSIIGILNGSTFHFFEEDGKKDEFLPIDYFEKSNKKNIKNKVSKVLLGTMMFAGLFMNKAEAKDIEDVQNNVLKAGKVVSIEYSENPESIDYKESMDKMYFKIENNIYIYYDFAEDMFAGDDVLLIVNTKGTENLKDDVIRDWVYWRPDCEVEYIDLIENGSCIN